MPPLRYDARLLQSFLMLADELHFGRAASRLNVTQPGLSAAIRRLESQLGVALFERSSRRVELSDAGRRVLPEARASVSHARRVEEVLRSASHRVVIGAVGDLGVCHSVLGEATRRVPEARLETVAMPSHAQVEAVRSGDIDIAWARLDGPAPDLAVHMARLEPLLAGLRPADGTPVSPTAPLDGTLTAARPMAAWRSYITALERELDVRLPPTRASVALTSHLSTAMLRPGERVLLPSSAAAVLESAGFAIRPFADVQPYYAWSLMTRPDPPATTARVAAAMREAAHRAGWTEPDPRLPGRPWLPAGDPHRKALVSDGERAGARASSVLGGEESRELHP